MGQRWRTACVQSGPAPATLEADFVGRHVSEFAGKRATGTDIRVPYSVVYDLQGTRSSRYASIWQWTRYSKQLEA
jgi:hypothetical protein